MCDDVERLESLLAADRLDELRAALDELHAVAGDRLAGTRLLTVEWRLRARQGSPVAAVRWLLAARDPQPLPHELFLRCFGELRELDESDTLRYVTLEQLKRHARALHAAVGRQGASSARATLRSRRRHAQLCELCALHVLLPRGECAAARQLVAADEHLTADERAAYRRIIDAYEQERTRDASEPPPAAVRAAADATSAVLRANSIASLATAAWHNTTHRLRAFSQWQRLLLVGLLFSATGGLVRVRRAWQRRRQL
eukprot:TRINITY_DN159_c0_g4_i1.p1 TRINITY_DN159_c0_g4~~TRINITY_DN159_c0_g4_i1.p1  ORF type:complete len:257 (+),score=134.09 TRINITY_DN159_c0_g4_i1:188-958(+)